MTPLPTHVPSRRVHERVHIPKETLMNAYLDHLKLLIVHEMLAHRITPRLMWDALDEIARLRQEVSCSH